MLRTGSGKRPELPISARMSAVLNGAENTSGGTMVPPEGCFSQGSRQPLRVERTRQHAGPGCPCGQPVFDRPCEVLLAP